MKFALFLPQQDRNVGIGNLLEKIAKTVINRSRKNFPKVCWVRIDNRKKPYDPEILGGIACGDEALDEIRPEYFGTIPILALTGKPIETDNPAKHSKSSTDLVSVKPIVSKNGKQRETKAKLGSGRTVRRKGIYPLFPSPEVSGFLLALAVIAVWKKSPQKRQKERLNIALLAMQKADDPGGARFPVFKRTLAAYFKNAEVNAEIKNIPYDPEKSEKDIKRKLKQAFSEGKIDFIGCHGYGKIGGKDFDAVIRKLAWRDKYTAKTDFCCDYNYSPKQSKKGKSNIHCICLKDYSGTDVFVGMACAAADILKTAFQEPEGGSALRRFSNWVSSRKFFPASIGTLWFVQSQDERRQRIVTLRQTFYRTTEDGILPLDFEFPEEVIPAENLIDFLNAEDKRTVEWQGDKKSPEELLAQVSAEVRERFHDVINVFPFWPGRIVPKSDEPCSSTPPWWDSSVLHALLVILAGCRANDVHAVQVNLDCDDMEDNGVFRLYADGGAPPTVPILTHILAGGTDCEVRLGQNVQDAKYSLGDKSSDILQGLKDIQARLAKERAKPQKQQQKEPPQSFSSPHVRYAYLLDCTPNEAHQPNEKDESPWGAIVLTSEKLNAEKTKIVHQVFKFAFSAIMVYQEKEHARQAQLQSAIGSIMSRNGSHNIGSHVLAALSHNVGTMPDDRVLYQYIQHRMDYIATATTDFPTWRQPTMFLGTLMKTFLSQRHLLDHIAGSEGLKGWKFQDRNSPDGRAVSGNSGCLQFRIYPNAKDEATKRWSRIREIKKDGKEGFVECIDYNGGRMANLSYDVSLAIPGGTIGQHAFFTIIENIIRNAAKHDWSSPPEKKAKPENLEINIDFADIPEEGKVLFTISTNLSDVTETESPSKEGVPLIDRINQKLSKAFIDSSGSLRRENWGLAEMKISAGYLQGREIGVIGGESTDEKVKIDEERFGKIISAVEVEGGHLGYQFCVPKARTLLLVTDNEVGLDKDKKKSLASNGIFVKTKKEIEPAKSENGAARLDNSFEFVLVYNRQDEMEDWLPSRVVAASEPVETILEAIFAGTTSPKAVIDDVAAKYVKKLVGQENSLNLVVAPFHGGSGGGQSLINKAAAVVFVFENGFKEAIEAFKLLYLTGDVNGDAKQLELMEETKNALNFFLEKSSSSAISEELKRSDSKNYNELMTIQFKSWLEDVAGPDLPTIRPFIENAGKLDKNHPYQRFCVYFGQVCKQAKGYLGLYAEKIATLPQGFEYNVSEIDVFPTTHWVDAVMDITKVKEPKDAFNCAKHRITIGFVRHYEVKTSEKYLSASVDNPFVGLRSKFRYLEPLSGSQSYLVQMQSLAPDDRTFQAKLVECALTRILIVDERVSKFAATHSADIRATLALMGIRVADDKAADDALNNRGAKECVAGLLQLPVEEIKALRTDIAESGNREVLRKRMAARKKVQDEFRQKFDVLIIHQGILDKWFRGLVDNKKKMSLVLAALREVFKQVVITTGRGTPANIPSKARVLPFSTIETTLFKKYPEKLILVDAIMNILPIHRE